MGQSRFHYPYITGVIAFINLLITLIVDGNGGSGDILVLIHWGAKVDALIWQGEYWRLLSSLFLHMGHTHLIFNVISLLFFGSFLEGFIGHKRFFFIYLASGLTGNMLSLAFSPSVSTGASGAILGIMGALLVLLLSRRLSISRVLLLILMTALVPFLIVVAYLATSSSGMDSLAHLGGFACGLLTGLIFSFSESRRARNILVAIASIAACIIIVLSARPNPDFIKKNYLLIGTLNYEKSRFSEAAAFFEHVTAMENGNIEALKKLGSAYIQKGEIRKGMLTWEELLEFDPDNNETKMNLSRIYTILAENALSSGNRSEAKELYHKCVTLNPRDPRPYLVLGLFRFEEGDYVQGIEKWQQALMLDPQNTRLLKSLKEQYRAYFRINAIIDNIHFIPERKPEKSALILDREGAKVLLETGDYERALSRFHKSIITDPLYSLPYLHIGQIYLLIGKNRQAGDYLNKCREIDPENWEIYTGLGDLASREKKYEEAINLYKKSLAIKKNYAPGYARIGEIYLEKRDYAKAADYVEKALELDMNNPRNHLIRASIAKASGDHETYFAETTSAIACARAHKNRELEEHILKMMKKSEDSVFF